MLETRRMGRSYWAAERVDVVRESVSQVYRPIAMRLVMAWIGLR